MIYFTAHTFQFVCHCIRTMFRVLGVYNFDQHENTCEFMKNKNSPSELISTHCKKYVYLCSRRITGNWCLKGLFNEMNLFEMKVNAFHVQKNNFITNTYRIVASTNTCYYSENQLFVQRSQYLRTENPLHKQSEMTKTCH